VLEQLAAAIASVEIGVDGDSIEEAIALRDRLDARIAQAVGEYEVTGWWAVDASASMVAWLRGHALMTRRSAQRLRTLASRLRALPVCATGYADGTLSGGQIEAILAHLDGELIDIFAAQEAELVPYLARLNVAGVSRAMSAWLARARPEPKEPVEPERSVHLSQTLRTRGCSMGRLMPKAARWSLPRCASPRPTSRIPPVARPSAGPTP
jgi:hypothetical protein